MLMARYQTGPRGEAHNQTVGTQRGEVQNMELRFFFGSVRCRNFRIVCWWFSSFNLMLMTIFDHRTPQQMCSLDLPRFSFTAGSLFLSPSFFQSQSSCSAAGTFSLFLTVRTISDSEMILSGRLILCLGWGILYTGSVLIAGFLKVSQFMTDLWCHDVIGGG